LEHKIDAKSKDLRTVSEEIRKAIERGDSVVIENAEGLHSLAAGLKKGTIVVNGHVGDYVATLNDGATILINGRAGKFVADNMTAGRVIIAGDAGYGAGEYCYGGTLVIKGNAGDFLGAVNKGATIIITGNSGDDIGTYMVGGDIIIVGDCGKSLGNYFLRGNIYVSGKWLSLGHNTKEEQMKSEDVRKLTRLFKENDVDADPNRFRKIVPVSIKPFY